eukprot:TRINITY_DN121362_c0_g1_i1.p1 TRINITY_DN121362_c0_g1~~TRINITY_DN121362_c0_g1_i1.p1  ORF type:complete len:517 (-),score=44.25 TRINITY_DN121362_c0_g1_i1:278-1828(-)
MFGAAPNGKCPCKLVQPSHRVALQAASDNPFRSVPFDVPLCRQTTYCPLGDAALSSPRRIAKELTILQQRLVEAHEQQVKHLQQMLKAANVQSASPSNECTPEGIIKPKPGGFRISDETTSSELEESLPQPPVGSGTCDEAVAEMVSKTMTMQFATEDRHVRWNDATKRITMKNDDLDEIVNAVGSQGLSPSPSNKDSQAAAWISTCAESQKFDLLIGLVIALNALYLAYETDYALTSPVDEPNPMWMVVMGKFFTGVFVFELVFRMCGGLRQFFCTGNTWNYFDFIVVTLTVAEEFLDGVATMSNMRMARIVRLTRTIKILHMLRIIRVISALRMIMFSLIGTLRQVFWSFLLIILLIFVFGIIFGQVVGNARSTYPDLVDNNENLMLFWGDMWTCMYSLYLSISGGISWVEPAEPLKEVGTAVFLGFLVYVALIQWVALNVITGCFCESAAEAARKDVHIAMQTHRSERDMYLQSLKAIFKSIDRDGSGRLEIDEMEPYLQSEPAHALFAFYGP